jgi:uncharacterized protein
MSVSTKKTLNSVLVKPTGPRCNLACSYCFYLSKDELFGGDKNYRMSEQILRNLVRQMMRQGGRDVSFGWQGGEPTLMGIPFFERAIEYQIRFGRSGQSVGNGLQTNGILIDDDWAMFLRDAHFLVGLSLDGPQHVHDRYRRFPSGKASWELVVKARDALLHRDVEVNALVVVNDYSANYAEEIYNFHKNSSLSYMQFIPCVEPDPQNSRNISSFSLSSEAYGRFLCELFDLWHSDFRDGKPTTSIRWFDSLFYTYIGLDAPECTLLQECGVYLVVEHNGDVYSCDFFVESRWHLGNVLTHSLVGLLNSPQQIEFGKIKTTRPAECAQCEWLMHCWGGCPKDRFCDPADKGSNHFCQSFKTFFAHSDGRFRKLADEWKKKQSPVNTRA